MVLEEKRDKKKTAVVVILIAAFLWGLYLSRDSWISPADKNSYFSGLLVNGEISKCGLMRKLMMDRFSCRLPREFCFENQKLLNTRLRFGALPEECRMDSLIKCSLTQDFFEENFLPTHCFGLPNIVKNLN